MRLGKVGIASIVAFIAVLACAAPAVAAPPANDAFASPQELSPATGTPANATGDNIDATSEAGEPNHAGRTARRSIWFTWTAAETRRVRISACGSNFNTRLAVYTGSTLTGLTPVAQNDDSSLCATASRSAVDMTAAAGVTYRIAIDGRRSSGGAASLAVTDNGPPPPANDDFAAAADFAPTAGLPAIAVGSNAGATAQPGEPSHDGRSASRSVWYRWTAPESEPIELETCASAVDARAAVYTGDSVAGLTRVTTERTACATGLGRTYTFEVNAGSSYRIAVDSTGSGGAISLALSRVPPRIEIGDTSVVEGDSGTIDAIFAVYLSRAAPEPVTVSYRTTNELISGTWRHFEPATGTLHFAPGESVKRFVVAVNGDIEEEDDEEIETELFGAVGGTIEDATATGTIVDDDDPPPDGWECGPLDCLVPGEGPVRMSRSPDPSELVRTLPIRRAPRPRAVMEIGAKRLGPVRRGDTVEASGEIEVSVTCLEAMKKCVGTRYRYSPRVRGKLVLSSAAADGRKIAVSRKRGLTCSQSLPHRNHHCVLVFPPQRTQVGRDCTGCRLTMVLSAAHPNARHGNKVVIGSDGDHGVQQDRGRLNAVVIGPGAERPQTANTGVPTRRSLTVGRRSSGGEKLVVYSHKLEDLDAHEQVFVDAKALIRTSHLRYATFFGSELVLTDDSRGVTPSSGAAADGSAVTEKNGFNCTRGRSAHDSPCRIRKVGHFRIDRDTERPLYVNLVVQAAARFGGGWHAGDRAKVLRGGIRTERYGPRGWARVATPP